MAWFPFFRLQNPAIFQGKARRLVAAPFTLVERQLCKATQGHVSNSMARLYKAMSMQDHDKAVQCDIRLFEGIQGYAKLLSKEGAAV